MESSLSLEEIKPSQTDLQFSGQGKEFFKIWIVNIFLTIITFGIYSAWAKVRTNRYFYANTSLAGSGFQYLAEPMNILKGRIVAVLLLFAYSITQSVFPQYAWLAFVILMVLMPGLIVLSLSFRLRNTAYRNLTFHFNRDFKQAYILFAVPLLLVILFVGPLMMHEGSAEFQHANEYNTMAEDFLADDEFTIDEEIALEEYANEHALPLDENGYAIVPSPPAWVFLPYLLLMLLYPLWDKLFTAFKMNNAQFGQSSFKFSGTTWDFYKMYLLFMGIIIGLSVFAAVIAYGITQFGSVMLNMQAYATVGFFALFAFYLWLFAYYTVYHHNLTVNKTAIEDIKLVSTLEVMGMWWIYLSNSIMIALTLGLATPWAKVRSVRYRVERTAVIAVSLDRFVGKQEAERRALGEEIGEAFDVDIGF